MNAEPSWRRQAISGILYRTKLAAKPRKIPKAVQLENEEARSARRRDQEKTTSAGARTYSCQDMTRPPRIAAGVFSAAKTGMVEAFMLCIGVGQDARGQHGDATHPIPRPSSQRHTNSCSQVCVRP